MPYLIKTFLISRGKDLDFLLGIKGIIPLLSDARKYIHSGSLLTESIQCVTKKIYVRKKVFFMWFAGMLSMTLQVMGRRDIHL